MKNLPLFISICSINNSHRRKSQLNSLSKSQKQTTTQFPKWVSLIKRQRSCALWSAVHMPPPLCSFAQQHSTHWMYFSIREREDERTCDIWRVSALSLCRPFPARTLFCCPLSDKISLKPYLAPLARSRSGFIFGAALHPSVIQSIKELGARRVLQNLWAQ
jgi:hypothetical protein